MGISEFFPNSDNFYKFLLVGGAILIVFALAYPSERELQIRTEQKVLLKDAEILNNELSFLENRYECLLKERDSVNKLRVQSIVSSKTSQFINVHYNKSVILDSCLRVAKSKNIEIKYKAEQVEVLKSQISFFAWLKWVLIGVGIIMLIFGLIKWFVATSENDKLRRLEIEEKRRKLINYNSYWTGSNTTSTTNN
ncbi:hypothetical protein [Edaphocola flava]|uniref:hypothetical protein n=1 Tax=Edaphocola flava TaxID=2499629 RepID=UPI00100B0AEF|nr:hypothetical protein [Edaphocola flava]